MKSPKKRKRPKPGDIIEIVMPHGYAYLQYVGKHPKCGHTIRVLSGIHAERPGDFAPLVVEDAYITFYPLAPSLLRGMTTIVDSVLLPEGVEVPARVRRPGGKERGGKILTWLIDDGDETTVHRSIGPPEIALPIAAVSNHEMLVGDICRDWRPEHVVHHMGGDKEAIEKSRTARGDAQREVMHRLRFPKKGAATSAAESLRDVGYIVDDAVPAEGGQWPIVAKHFMFPGDDTTERARKKLQQVAKEQGGQYDGLTTEAQERQSDSASAQVAGARRPEVASSSDALLNIDYYLYFPKKAAASSVAKTLRDDGYSTKVDRSALGKDWLVLATHRMAPGDPAGDKAREKLERIATENGGEYDGSETQLPN